MHKPTYKKITKARDIFASPSVKRLVYKHARLLGIDDDSNIEMVKEMTLAGLEHDFFGSKRGKPTEAHSEYEFDLHIKNEEKDYCIKGFIDKLFYIKKIAPL